MVESVRTRRAFSALSSSRNRGRSGPVWVVRADAPVGDEDGRLDGVAVAYAVGKATGNAVARNRLRRRLRVHMNDLELSGVLEPGLYLVGVSPTAAVCSFAELGDHLSRAVGHLANTDRVEAAAR